MNSNAVLGSFYDMQLPAKLENEKSNQEKSQKASEGERQGDGDTVKSVKKKRKQRGESIEDGELPGPSCPQTTPQRRKKRKLSYCEFFSPIFSVKNNNNNNNGCSSWMFVLDTEEVDVVAMST